ncbi:uncharacterized protein LOC143039531 [Oratosquilla oratoria]|uniref:uncharacterized protein LOC143039531 n=1 Tax=Oratosquilla oratoria TaxID=337810 RepID=UPI003F76BEE7
MCRSLIAATTLLLLLVGCHQGFAYKECPEGYILLEEYCIKVAHYQWKANKTYTYAEAQFLCQRSLPSSTGQSDWTGNLVGLNDSEKLEAISKHVFEDYSGYVTGIPHWVGGEYVNGVWRWVDGSKIDLRSHIFLPYEPQINGTNRAVYIVSYGTQHKRYHADTYPKTGGVPSYICEAKEK